MAAGTGWPCSQFHTGWVQARGALIAAYRTLGHRSSPPQRRSREAAQTGGLRGPEQMGTKGEGGQGL